MTQIRPAASAASTLPLQLRDYDTIYQAKQQASFLVQISILV
jgi:hypothetical protein